MTISLRELRLYGSATMPDDDTATNIGGAIATSRRPCFQDVNGLVQVVSESAADVAQSMTVHYRDSTGAILTEAKTLTGHTPVAYVATMERLLKAIVTGGSISGNMAVEAQTAERSNTAQAGSADGITLDAAASAVDQAYRGMVIRLTSGPASGAIAEIIDYNGTTKVALVSREYLTLPTSATGFRIAKGFFFDSNASLMGHDSQVTEVRRVFYDAAADVPGGTDKRYYDKVFWKNTSNETLTAAAVSEYADPSGLVAFGLPATVDDTAGNGGGNTRLVAPAGITFASTGVSVPGDALAGGERIGVWLRLSLDDGEVAQKTTYSLQLAGTTV